MRRLLVILVLSFGCLAAGAANWTAKTNTALRDEMLAFAEKFRQQVVGEEIFTPLTEFIAQVNALSASSPYAWMDQTHRFVSDQLSKYPPAPDIPISSREKGSLIRKNLLCLRDFPMHQNNSASVTPTPESGQAEAFVKSYEGYLGQARRDFLSWLASPAPDRDGVLEIFKVYNLGFAFRTSKRTVLFDIHWDGTDEEARYIASKADIIFLTHNHGDHFSQILLNAMADEGKCLVMPLDKVPSYNDSARKIVRNETFGVIDVGGVKVQGFLGYQNGTDCFVYAVEFDGWRLAHGGDNQTEDAEKPLSTLEAFDVVTIAIFARPQSIMSQAMAARNASGRDLVFLSGHENEKSHEVSGRIGFNQAYGDTNKFGSTSFQYPAILIMDCGESITLEK